MERNEINVQGNSLSSSSTMMNNTNLQSFDSNKIIQENILDLKGDEVSFFIKQKRQEMITILHDLENFRSDIRKVERSLKLSFQSANLNSQQQTDYNQYTTKIGQYIKLVEQFGEFSENNFDFFMNEQLQMKDNFMTIFSDMNTQLNSIQEDNKILKNNLLEQMKDPESKKKLNHYSELYKDNIFMKKIVKHKEKLIKKYKEEKKTKSVTNTLVYINQLVEKIDLIRNFQKSIKNNQNMIKHINTLRQISESEDLKNIEKLNSLKDEISNIPQINIDNNDQEQQIKQNATIKEFKSIVMEESLKIISKEKQIKKLKKKIKKNNENYMASKLEFKLIQKMSAEMNTRTFQQLNNKNEKNLQELENQILQDKEKVIQIQEEIKQIKKYLAELYKENKQKIQMITVIARMKNQNFIKIKKDLQYQVRQYITHSEDLEDIKGKILYKNFRDMQHIFFTLRSNVFNTMAVPKNKHEQQIKQEQKDDDEAFIDWEKMGKGIEENAEKFNEVLKNKTETIKQMNNMIEQIKNMNNAFSTSIQDSKELNLEIKENQNKVEILQEKIEEQQTELIENEKLLIEYKNDNQVKQEVIQVLNKKIVNQKKSIDQYSVEKKSCSKKLKIKELELEQKLEELNETQQQLKVLSNRNKELKDKLDDQFKNFQKICEDTMNRYTIFDDLIKRDKVQIQLLKLQNKKMIGKDKLIQQLQDTMNQKDILIEKLLREKQSITKGENLSALLQLLPSTQKKYEKQITNLNKQLAKSKKNQKQLQEQLNEYQSNPQSSTLNSKTEKIENKPKKKYPSSLNRKSSGVHKEKQSRDKKKKVQLKMLPSNSDHQKSMEENQKIKVARVKQTMNNLEQFDQKINKQMDSMSTQISNIQSKKNLLIESVNQMRQGFSKAIGDSSIKSFKEIQDEISIQDQNQYLKQGNLSFQKKDNAKNINVQNNKQEQVQTSQQQEVVNNNFQNQQNRNPTKNNFSFNQQEESPFQKKQSQQDLFDDNIFDDDDEEDIQQPKINKVQNNVNEEESWLDNNYEESIQQKNMQSFQVKVQETFDWGNSQNESKIKIQEKKNPDQSLEKNKINFVGNEISFS